MVSTDWHQPLLPGRGAYFPEYTPIECYATGTCSCTSSQPRPLDTSGQHGGSAARTELKDRTWLYSWSKGNFC
jgi:hypothetical protein